MSIFIAICILNRRNINMGKAMKYRRAKIVYVKPHFAFSREHKSY